MRMKSKVSWRAKRDIPTGPCAGILEGTVIEYKTHLDPYEASLLAKIDHPEYVAELDMVLVIEEL